MNHNKYTNISLFPILALLEMLNMELFSWNNFDAGDSYSIRFALLLPEKDNDRTLVLKMW